MPSSHAASQPNRCGIFGRHVQLHADAQSQAAIMNLQHSMGVTDPFGLHFSWIASSNGFPVADDGCMVSLVPKIRLTVECKHKIKNMRTVPRAACLTASHSSLAASSQVF